MKPKYGVEYNYLEPLKYYLEKMSVRILKIEYLENIEITVELTEEISNQITNNYNNSKFLLSKYDILKEKFVEI